MFDFLGPIGAINTPDGALEYGNVGATDCIYLRYTGLKDVVPCLIYTADELKSLLDIVRQGESLAKGTEAGQIIFLGVMPPKPITLRLALVHPREGPPFLLLRLLQGNWKTDIVTGGFGEFARLLEVGVGPAQRPLQGPLKRRPGGGWRVAGQNLDLLQGLSPGAGGYGEYLHPDEVREGEVIEVWTFGQDGKEFVAAFRTRSRWRPPARVENREGQEGDNLLFSGQLRACQEVHEKLGRQMMKSGRVDATWASKLTLTALVRAILSGQDEVGHAIWLGRSPEPILQIGLKAIEAGQTSIQDARLYHQVSCYYHSLNPNEAEAARAIDGIMASVFQSLEPKDWQEKRLTLNNWYLYLAEVCEGRPSDSVLSEWKKCRALYSGEVIPKALHYPPPYPWNIDWEAGETVIVGDSRPAMKSGVRPFFKILPVAVGLFLLLLVVLDYTKKPPANIVDRPRARARSKAPTPALAPIPTPKVQTPELALSGEWLVCGFGSKEKRRADRADLGEYKLKGLGPTWARFESGEHVLLTGIQRPSTNITSYVGETLWVEGKMVDTSGLSFEQLQEATKNQTGRSRVDVLEGLDGRFYFKSGSSSGLIPLPGQAPCTEVLTALESLDLEGFKRAVNSKNVNALFRSYNNTEGLLALTAGYSPRVKKNIARGRQVSYAPFVRVLLERGADVERYGEEAFWKTSDVETAALLLDAGVPVNCRNDKGRTKLFHASKDMEAFLLARGIDPKLRDNDGKTRDEFRKRRRK